MENLIKKLKKEYQSLPFIDYTGIYYEPNLGFKVFLIYVNENAESCDEDITLWTSKHYWNETECSINEYVCEVEMDAYIESFKNIEDAIDYIEMEYEPLDVIWKNSEEELEKQKTQLKNHCLYIAPFNKKMFVTALNKEVY